MQRTILIKLYSIKWYFMEDILQVSQEGLVLSCKKRKAERPD